MELDESVCIARLRSKDHGVLATVHPERGVDVVPVVFALHGRRIVIPVDTIKQKRSTDLQRSKNLPRRSPLRAHRRALLRGLGPPVVGPCPCDGIGVP